MDAVGNCCGSSGGGGDDDDDKENAPQAWKAADSDEWKDNNINSNNRSILTARISQSVQCPEVRDLLADFR